MGILIKVGDIAKVTWNGNLYNKTIHGHIVEVTDKYIKLVELEGQKQFRINRKDIKEYYVKHLRKLS